MNAIMRRSVSLTGALAGAAIAILSCQEKSSPTSGEPGAPNDTIPTPAGWMLVWNDEFSGPRIDSTKWTHEVNDYGGGNNELQYYTARPENSFIEDGSLVIQARKEPYLTRQYTSARMITRLKGDWRYGRFEIKAQLPYGKGLWPAIWMMPTDSEYGGWPSSGEIDIMELLGHEPWKTYGTIHFGTSPATRQQSGGSYTLPAGTFAGGFNVFALEWDSTQIRWYVNDVKYYQASIGPPFDKRFFMILNVAVGGNWPGNTDEFTVFPQRMTIDYVRVFRRK